MEDDGWDLQAVVRGFRLTSPPATAATLDPFSSFSPAFVKEEPTFGDGGLTFPELSTNHSSLQELDELCKAFACEAKPQPVILPQRSSPSSSQSVAAPPPAQLLLQPKQPLRSVSQMSRSKRRKNQQKRVVCHVPADGLPADVWAWRKYGQKPIKGSPYPRGYYRCSSSKGCLARKQVERSRTDPGTFIITYTAEHNHPAPAHRNSLAGSTRTKFPSSSTSAAAASSGAAELQQQSPLSSPPQPAVGLSPNTPLTSSMEEEDEDEEGVLMVEDMEVMAEDDLVFLGLDETSGGSAGGAAAVGSEFLEGGGGEFDESLFAPPSWLASSSSSNAAAAAGGSL